MNQRSKVFVLCPANTTSGGPEALHQFAGALRGKGVDAAIVYYPNTAQTHSVPVPYRQYSVAVSPNVDDEPSTVVVVPEVVTSLAWSFPLSRKAIWWLSIDNYFKWQHLNPGPSVLDHHTDVFHLCQSHYALDFLTRRQVGPLLMLTDFLTENMFTTDAPSGRIPVAAYNAKRVSKAMHHLMMQVGDAMWLPLENMEKGTVSDILRNVRLYVDLGHHPGRDRLPREASLCGAVVITGRQGAAGFPEDVPIPDKYKLSEHAADSDTRGAELINGLLRSDIQYEEAWTQQAPYRDWIKGQRMAFLAEVDTFIAAMNLAIDGELPHS